MGYIDGMNLYEFVNGNPVNRVDPWGLLSYSIGAYAEGFGKGFVDYFTSGGARDALYGYGSGLQRGFIEFFTNVPDLVKRGFERTKGVLTDPLGQIKRDIDTLQGLGENIGDFYYNRLKTGKFFDDIKNNPCKWGESVGEIAGNVEAGLAVTAGSSWAKEKFFAGEGIRTPYGIAKQKYDPVSLAARAKVKEGATLYRIGTLGKSETSNAQFWSLEHPSNIKEFASRYGIPSANVENVNFIEAATIKTGTPFITRPAPNVGGNIGGGIEVVVSEGGVKMEWFSMLDD